MQKREILAHFQGPGGRSSSAKEQARSLRRSSSPEGVPNSSRWFQMVPIALRAFQDPYRQKGLRKIPLVRRDFANGFR